MTTGDDDVADHDDDDMTMRQPGIPQIFLLEEKSTLTSVKEFIMMRKDMLIGESLN